MNVWKTGIKLRSGDVEVQWHQTCSNAHDTISRHIVHQTGKSMHAPEKHSIYCSRSDVVAALNRFATNKPTEGRP